MIQNRSILSIFILTIICHCRYSRSKLISSVQCKDIALWHFTSEIKHILKEHFLQERYLLIIDNDSSSSCKFSSDVLKYIHASSTVSTLSLSNFTNEKNFTQFHIQDNIENSVCFIIFKSTILNKCFLNDHWTNSAIWNPRAYFLFVITGYVNQKTLTMKNLFEDCWAQYNILNMLVVFSGFPLKEHSRNENDSWGSKLEVRTMIYNPFTKKIHLTNLADGYKTFCTFQGFPDKLQDTKGFVLVSPLDYYHPLLIETVAPDGSISLSGPDGNVFTTIINKMNFTVNYLHLNDNAHNYKLNSTIHGLSPQQYSLVRLFNEHKSTYPHDQECVTLIVPRALEIPKYMNIILPFSATIWLMFVLSNLFMAFVWKVLAFYNIPGSKTSPQSSVLIETFNMSLGGAPRSLPSLFSQRFLILMCLVFNLLMNSTYKGLLYSFLTIPMYYPDMNTIMEALDSDLRVSVSEAPRASSFAIDSLKNNKILNKLTNNVVIIKDTEKALSMIAFSRNMSRVSFKFYGQISASKPEFIHNGRAQLHVVDDCYISFLTVFNSVEPHSPFLTKFNDIIVRLKEAGLIPKWKKDILSESLQIFNKIGPRSGPTPLKVDHLQTPFYLLGYGLILSCLVIFVEIAAPRVLKMH